MKSFWKNYKQTIILLISIIIGAIVGLIFKEKTAVLAPFGDVFLNLLLVIIVPLIFLTISTSIAKISTPRRLGKILGTTILVFIITSLVAVLFGLLITYSVRLVDTEDSTYISSTLEGDTEAEDSAEDISILSRFMSALTVNDFAKLTSKENLVAIIVFSILFGIAIKITGEKGNVALGVLESFMNVIMSLLKIIMYYAPIGLGCYFAVLVGTFGASIAVGYLKTFIVYTLAAIVFYLVIYTLYAFIAGGRKGVKKFWGSILPATVTALATCSSAASIPTNLKSARDIGVSDDICETLIPLGTSFHKDGSIIGSVFKIMFLVCIFGTPVYTFPGFLQVLLVALLATLFVAGIPIGGGTISEMMILTMMGYPVAALPILTIIATIIDPPATLLNVVGDTSASMLAARIIDGKKWMGE